MSPDLQVSCSVPFKGVWMRATELEDGRVAVEAWSRCPGSDEYLYTGVKVLDWINDRPLTLPPTPGYTGDSSTRPAIGE